MIFMTVSEIAEAMGKPANEIQQRLNMACINPEVRKGETWRGDKLYRYEDVENAMLQRFGPVHGPRTSKGSAKLRELIQQILEGQ
jgi:hypothetical protein